MRRGGVLAAAALFGLFFLAAPARASLDGTAWKLRTKNLISRVVFFWKSDRLEFRGGMFTSKDCLKAGFKATRYLFEEKGVKIIWSTTQTNVLGEKIEWQGTSEHHRMRGTYRYTDKSGRVKTVRWKARQTR